MWNYVYDTENMLLNASKPGTSASYIYDPLGRRSAKSVNGILTTFLHDGVEEIADYNSSGTLLRRYVHGPGVDEYLVMYTGTGTASKSYFHANHQGSIVAMSNASGNVTEQHSYDSYGNSATLAGAPFRYTGRRLDAETGLYYYRARYYSPAIGRFLQTDPIGYGDGLNWYAYIGNDPMNGTDPSGNATCADKNCDTARIDPVLTKGAPPIDSSLKGNPDAETVSVTFENDDPNGKSTNQPVTTETAKMVEEGIKKSTESHVNINSTTGGKHSPQSRHTKGKAVDINKINAERVDDPNNSAAVDNLQESFSNTSNIRENLGPNRQEKTVNGKIILKPKLAPTHQNHIHVSGQN